MNKQKVALVLSTGGARGMAHIGAIEEIEKQGYEISSIAGCSMGAMVAAFYVTGSLSEGKEFLCSLKKRRNLLRLVDIAFSKKGLIRGNEIVNELKKILPPVNIEELSIPFAAIATNIIDGKEIVFKEGNLLDAVRASISLPSIFMPLKKNGMLLTDGGMINPLPLNRIERTVGDLLIGVAVGAEDKENILPKSTDKHNMCSLMMESTTITIQKLINGSIEKYKPDIMIQVPNRKYGILQFNAVFEIMENGVKATRTALNQFEKNQK